MKKTWIRLLSILLAAVMIFPAAALAGDQVDPSGPAIVIPPAGGDIALFVGKTTQISYQDDTVAGWDSQNDGVATVSSTGLVTAVAKGTAVIRAYDANYATVGGLYTVTVSEASITSIAITTEPQKDYVSGQALNTSGMVVTVYYNSGDKEQLQASSVTVEPKEEGLSLNNLTAGKHTIAVKYQGYEDTYEINVAERTVLSIECVDEKTKYEVGDSFMGVKVRVNYSDGSHDILISGYTVSPESAAKGVTSYTVTYRDKSATKTGITVTDTSGGGGGGGSGETTTDEYTLTVVTAPTTKSYMVGSQFDTKGMSIAVRDKTNKLVATLSGSTGSNPLVAFPYTFAEKDISETGKTTSIIISVVYGDRLYNVTVTGLTVTPAKKTLSLKVNSYHEISGIRVELKKEVYPVGTTFSLNDIYFITGLDKDNNVISLSAGLLEEYSNKFSLEVAQIDSRGNTSRKSSTSSRAVLNSGDVWTLTNGDKIVYMRFYVDDDYYEFEWDTGDSAAAVYSGTTLLGSFDDIVDALDAANDVDYKWNATTNYSGTSYRASITLTLKLGADATITRSDGQISLARNLTIDLNGHKLSAYPDVFVFLSKKNDTYKATITNTNADTAKFVYTNLDVDNILLDKNESIVFQYEEDQDANYPGLYTVTVEEPKNGTVTAKPTLSAKNTVIVAHGNDITFTVTPDKNYEIESVKTKLGTASATTVSSTTNSGYSLNTSTGVATYTLKDVQKDVVFTAAFKAVKKEEEKKEEEPKKEEQPWTNPFSDVSTYASYYDAVKYVNQNGLMNGMTTTSFGPSETMTRAQFVTTLGRMYLSTIYSTTSEKDAAMVATYGTSSQFSDVSYSDGKISYAVPYIKWAEANGLVLGYGNGKFGPNDTITHQQMYIIMYRYASTLAQKTINVNGVTLRATDANELGAGWLDSAKEGAIAAAKYAQQQNFLVNTTRIAPSDDAIRSELAILLMQFSKNVLGRQ